MYCYHKSCTILLSYNIDTCALLHLSSISPPPFSFSSQEVFSSRVAASGGSSTLSGVIPSPWRVPHCGEDPWQFLKTLAGQYIPVHSSIFQYTLVHSSTLQYIPVYPSTLQYTPVYSSTLQYIPVYPSTLQYTPVYPSTLQYTPVYPSTLQYTPVHSSTLQYTPVYMYFNGVLQYT